MSYKIRLNNQLPRPKKGYLTEPLHILRMALWLAFCAVWLSGCATLNPGYQKPEINLVSIKPLASENLEQRFLLGLRIINPNNQPLPISGFSYNLNLQGHKVLTGATASNTKIPAFGNVLVDLESTTNLLGGFGVLREMLNNPDKPFVYELELHLHSGWWQIPVKIVEAGQIDLSK